MCRAQICRWNGKIADEVPLCLCIGRRISVQGICVAVVPLFIFNDTRKKNVIMACLPQSPPCLWTLWDKGKWESSVFWQQSASQSRSEAILPRWLCSFCLTAAFRWATSHVKEHGRYKQCCEYQNLTKAASTVFPLGLLCTFDSPGRPCLLRFSPQWLAGFSSSENTLMRLLDLRMQHQNGASLRNRL